MTAEVDLFVIGGGSAGVRAARVAAEHGARVAIAEDDRWGGTCVVRGCIPKKLMVYAAQLGDDIEDARAFGWRVGEATCDLPRLHAAVSAEVDRLSRAYAARLERAGVRLIAGRARLTGPGEVEVAGERIGAGAILVATGAAPARPGFPGDELAITSDDVFRMTTLPGRIAVVGGGYIAVELAHVLRGLGARVTLVHRGAALLRGFDGDVAAAVGDGLTARGIDVRLEERVSAATRAGAGLHLALAGGDALEVDALLVATGRRPRTAGLGLAEVGVTLGEHGEVVVDAASRSSVASIYAVGDCTGRRALTPVAIREGQAVADALFGGVTAAVDYTNIPTAVFAIPPAASVGLTEAEARARGPVTIYRSRFRPLRHTVSGRARTTLMKLVVDGGGRVVGAHIVGDDAPEMIQCLAVAVRLGVRKVDLDDTVALHPTGAEELVLMRTAADPR